MNGWSLKDFIESSVTSPHLSSSCSVTYKATKVLLNKYLLLKGKKSQ